MDSCLERKKKWSSDCEFLYWIFELTGHWCAATDQKREGGSRGKDSVEKPSTCWAHTDTHTSTYLHTSIQHICTWRGRDGKSFQLSVGVFVCWLQIAKRAQRLYIALNLRLSFVETSSAYLFSGVGDSKAFAWLTDWLTDWLVSDWLVDWRPPQTNGAFTLLEIVFKLPPLKGGQLYPQGWEGKNGARVESACDSHIHLPRVHTYSNLFSHDTDASQSSSSLHIFCKQHHLKAFVCENTVHKYTVPSLHAHTVQ